MTYNPINTQAFTAAFSGAVAGMAVNGWITSPDASTYTLVCSIAGAFAQAFDIAWNNATALNGLEYSAIQQVTAQEFAQRGPGPLSAPQFSDPANWETPATACAILALQADAYYVAQGITPPPIGSGGGIAEASARADAVDVPLNTPTNIDLDLSTFAASLNTNPQIWMDGYLVVDVVPGDESVALVVGTYDLQISLDGGINFIQSGVPTPFSALGSTTQNVTLSLPLAFAIGSVGDLTGNLIARVVVSITNMTSGVDATCAAYVQTTVAGPAPQT